MNSEFVAAIDCYISSHEPEFRAYIQQSSLIWPDGSINTAEIDTIAEFWARRLIRICGKAYASTAFSTPTETALQESNNEITYLLFDCFINYGNYIPLTIAIAASNKEIFALCCQRLTYFLQNSVLHE